LLLSPLGGLARAAQGAAPEAETLLNWALQPPTTDYRGRMLFLQWFGPRARADQVRLYRSGERSRREYLAPDGSLKRVIISDGDKQVVQFVKKGRLLQGDAVGSREKLMSPKQERALLLKNYRLSASGPESVAGRPCWLLKIVPRAAGKPEQTLWLDQETHVLLENKRALPGKPLAAMVLYTSFKPEDSLPDSLFALNLSSAPLRPVLAPEFLTLAQLNAQTGNALKLPGVLPGGFEFESADHFTVRRSIVRHARYTDGLTVLSLFLTDKPVRMPRGGSSEGLASASLRLSSAGSVLRWRRGRVHYTLLGDVTKELLQNVARALIAASR
ncbi:MAG: hypothetical protein KGK30_05440, partial [Elusimicrobia bacterium]|nr:hypothetical protein [Elusimicrobiota bacterium]